MTGKKNPTERQRARTPRGASPIVLVAGLLLAAVLIVGAVFVLGRVNPPAAASTGSSTVRAATKGHAPYELLTAEDGAIRLPASTFDDGKARYYTYMSNGRPIELFVLQSSDGVVRTAFNACDVCFEAKKGYTQAGDVMVCNNCGSRFQADQINVVRGGCNPSPLNATVDGEEIVIQAADIESGLRYF